MNIRAYLPIIIATIVWGIAFPISKIVLYFMSPMILSFMRFLIGALVLFTFSRKILINLKTIINSLLNIGIVITLLNFGLTITSDPAFASVLLYSQPIFVLILSYFYLNSKLSNLQKIGIIVAFFGLIIGVGSYEIDLGVILLLIAGFSWAAGTVYYRRNFSNENLIALTTTMCLISAIFDLPFLPVNFYFIPSLIAIILTIIIGILVQAIGWLLWFKSIDLIGPITTSLLSLLVPVFAYIFTLIILQQLPATLRILGSSLVIVGIFLSEYEAYRLSKIPS